MARIFSSRLDAIYRCDHRVSRPGSPTLEMGACCGKPQEERGLNESLIGRGKSTSALVKKETPRFSVPVVVINCTHCEKPIASQFEAVRDSRSRPYHTACGKCSKCSRSLSGEGVYTRDGKVFCRLHSAGERSADVVSSPAGASLVASALEDTAQVDVADICEAMIDKIVMMPPTCAACGGLFSIKV